MNTQKRKLINLPLSKLNMIGIFCLYKTSFKQNLVCVFSGLSILFCVLSAIPQYFYMKHNIFDFVDNTEAIAGLGQVVAKLCLTAYNKQKFINLIKLSEKFWGTDKSSKSLKTEVNGLVRAVIIFQKVLFYAMATAIPVFLLPLFFGKKLPMGSFTMENHSNFYRFLLATHISILPFVVLFVASFEGLFLGFCYEIIAQFRILRDSLENLTVNNLQNYEELKSNIQHHIFLLRFIKEMQKVYSAILIIQYLTMTPLICTEIFVISTSTDVLLMIRYAFSCIGIITQFAFYCIPASYVIDEITTVSYGIYNSDWFSKDFRQLRSPLVLVIQASQNDFQFRAGGLIPININTLFAVVKVAISASAVFKNLKQ